MTGVGGGRRLLLAGLEYLFLAKHRGGAKPRVELPASATSPPTARVAEMNTRFGSGWEVA